MEELKCPFCDTKIEVVKEKIKFPLSKWEYSITTKYAFYHSMSFWSDCPFNGCTSNYEYESEEDAISSWNCHLGKRTRRKRE